MLRSEEANEGLSNNVNNPTKHTLYWILLPNSQDCHFLKISIPRRIQILFSIKKGQWHLTMLPSEDADEGLSNNMNDATKHILQYIIANGWSLSLFKDPNLCRIQILFSMWQSEDADEGFSNNVNDSTKHTLYWMLLPNSQDCHFLKIPIHSLAFLPTEPLQNLVYGLFMFFFCPFTILQYFWPQFTHFLILRDFCALLNKEWPNLKVFVFFHVVLTIGIWELLPFTYN